jgi:polyphosphate glucokinase
MNILVVDIGGTHVKLLASGQDAMRRFDSSPKLTPKRMVSNVLALADGWAFDAVSIGYPGPVLGGKPLLEPHNLAPGWVGFDFAAAFGKPVKLINDAAMQALGGYTGGKLLFLGLGTGLGTAMIVDGTVEPMELAHLPYKKATFEDYVGQRGLDRHGKKKWADYVFDTVERLSAALEPDEVILGGGNALKLPKLPKGVRLGENANAFKGGFKLWEVAASLAATTEPPKKAAKRSPTKKSPPKTSPSKKSLSKKSPPKPAATTVKRPARKARTGGTSR